MKLYNDEKAIISLTSWKKRITNVSKTIFSILQNCPGFHIVLVLSTDEFPLQDKELPNDLRLLCDSNLIEILWVKENWKSFKKVLFTMDKYRTVPIISADDDCIYTKNYAEELYKLWEKHKKHCISYWVEKIRINRKNYYHTGGQGTIFPPYCFGELGIKKLNMKKAIDSGWQDDCYYSYLRNLKKIECIQVNRNRGFSDVCIQTYDDVSLRKTSYKRISTIKGIKLFL